VTAEAENEPHEEDDRENGLYARVGTIRRAD
jgi:hypothetical protein